MLFLSTWYSAYYAWNCLQLMWYLEPKGWKHRKNSQLKCKDMQIWRPNTYRRPHWLERAPTTHQSARYSDRLPYLRIALISSFSFPINSSHAKSGYVCINIPTVERRGWEFLSRNVASPVEASTIFRMLNPLCMSNLCKTVIWPSHLQLMSETSGLFERQGCTSPNLGRGSRIIHASHPFKQTTVNPYWSHFFVRVSVQKELQKDVKFQYIPLRSMIPSWATLSVREIHPLHWKDLASRRRRRKLAWVVWHSIFMYGMHKEFNV